MEITHYERPNFLGSEVGLVLKTITVAADDNKAVMENGRKVVKAGTIMTTPYEGLLYADADITDGAVIRPLMFAGYYIDAKLPSTASSNVTNFAKHGLFPITYSDAVRPDFGTTSLPKLGKPTATNNNLEIQITKVENAVSYNIYDKDMKLIAVVEQASAPTYTTSVAGDYYIRANGDNINYSASELSNKITTNAAV